MAVNPENYFTGNGSTTSFTLTFEYLDESDVKVSIDGVVKTQDTDYSFANATTILFTSAPATGEEIRIYRDTNVDELKSTFFAGSSIRAQDLNKNFEQNNFAVQEIKAYTWDNEADTIHSDETWVSSNSLIATTAAMDARFQDEAAETIESTETWASNDNRIATTAAIDNRVDSKIDDALTGDIGTDGTGITVTDDGDGTITLGLGAGSIDLNRIKAGDIITQAEQNADYDLAGDNDSVFTSSAAIRRFENYVQNSQPSSTGIGKGRVWVDVENDLTLSVWNGSQWLGITSGGTFTNQPRVVYVDANSGDDANDGHRISRPKASIKAAINQINADATYGDGSVVIVAAGVYQEVAPIQINKKNVSIIGQALRSCIVHPTSATETNTLFELNSGSYVANLTLTGMKAGTGTGNTLDAALPTTQGWNFAFRSGATITKSPYIQNCTNFSDSEIDNDNLNAVTPAGGAAGDTDSAPTGGGLLVNGATVDSNSPLRSMVCDSYTHVGLNGPGILVTNNGYVQATSSYAFFNKYHIKCLNGGQANLAASTTDFGAQALVADGKSTTAIFTAALSTAASDGDITFTIGAPTADASWHGTATRPQSNMLVELNSIIYPVLSATANGSGWDVTISRPNPSNRSENLGLDGAVATPATASFFLRSQIASSGHTMEYVGSGTDYSALPENGGVPDDTQQVIELNGGKIWTATTDHNGKFIVGPLEVDQRTGAVTIAAGSTVASVVNDPSPQLGGDLDANGNDIILATGTAAEPSLRFTGDANTGIYSPPGEDLIAISTGGTGRLFIDSSGRVGIGGSPSSAFEVRAVDPVINLVDTDTVRTGAVNSFIAFRGSDDQKAYFGCPGTGDTRIWVRTADPLLFGTDNSERLRIDSSGKLLIGSSTARAVAGLSGAVQLGSSTADGSTLSILRHVNGTGGPFLALGKSRGTSVSDNTIVQSGDVLGEIRFSGADGTDLTLRGGVIECQVDGTPGENVMPGRLVFSTNSGTGSASTTERMRIDSSGNVGINRTNPTELLDVNGKALFGRIKIGSNSVGTTTDIEMASSAVIRSGDSIRNVVNDSGHFAWWVGGTDASAGTSGASEVARIDSFGRLLMGTSSAITTGTDNQLQLSQDSGPVINLGRSSTTVGGGGKLGALAFWSNASGTWNSCAEIRVEADGTAHSSTSKPTRIEFFTTGDDLVTTERFRINRFGAIGLSGGNYGSAGQVLTSNGNAAPTWQNTVTVSSEVASTSGSQIAFTGLTNVNHIIINFNQVSTTGSGDLLIQLGNSSGYLNANYDSTSVNAAGTLSANRSNAFVIDNNSNSNIWSGQMTISKIDSSAKFASTHSVHGESDANIRHGAGSLDTTSANPVDRVRITLASGTFDGGSVNIVYW